MFFLDSEGFIKTKKQAPVFNNLVKIDHENIKFEVFTDKELVDYASRGFFINSVLVFDWEVYPNYACVSFKSPELKKVVYFEQSPDVNLDRRKLDWIMRNFCVVSFNGNRYDMVITWLALRGASTLVLKEVTDKIIKFEQRPKELEKEYRFKIFPTNHIDLIEVAPSADTKDTAGQVQRTSLKTYSGRLHAPRMQDLPYPPETYLTREQARNVLYYNINDLDNTILLYTALLPQLKLRIQLGSEYKQDLRSKSDAQIAEAVISHEVQHINGYYAKRPKVEPGTVFKYNVPEYMQFKTQRLQTMLETIRSASFVIAAGGGFVMPEEIKDLKINIGSSVYRMGLGGLHSSEKCVSHKSDLLTIIKEFDVSSYYPRTILSLGLYPYQMGKTFLVVYDNIVERRLIAKSTGDKVTADSLKITINGSFGKLGSKYSALYAPQLMIQVTITGQLALLMLIEAIECVGIPVVSANTDGIVIKCPRDRQNDLQGVVQEWERLTGYDMEEGRYKAIFSRDVNNYIGVPYKFDKVNKVWLDEIESKCKTKGAFKIAEPGKFELSKNPTNSICVEAAIELITKNIPVKETILNCKDITKFITVRNVKGGGFQDDVYLGKAVRWYYAEGCKGEINYITSGNVAAKSKGAKPIMDLPPEFPTDINYKWYLEETEDILTKLAYYAPKTLTFF